MILSADVAMALVNIYAVLIGPADSVISNRSHPAS
jgi:hypothetical protein